MRDLAEVLRRYYQELHPEKHWIENERENSEWGQLAELLFSEYLLQFKVPNLYGFPSFSERLGIQPFDFFVPYLGSIEVKAVLPDDAPPPKRRWQLLVKKSEWHKSDYVVAVKFLDLNKEHARFVGWLPGSEVEKLPTKEYQAESYAAPLAELKPFSELHDKVLKVRDALPKPKTWSEVRDLPTR